MSKTVMTVDDSASMRLAVGYTLKGAGFNVIEAIDGRDALEKLTGSRVSMIITDVNMPNLDGIELVREVRGLVDYKFVPIIILTTVTQESRREEAKSAGASGWLMKPFSPEQLLWVVGKFMS